MPEEISSKINSLLKVSLHNSNIIRIGVFVIILSLYYIFLSPFVESKLVDLFAGMIREGDRSEVNTLTPVFDIHVYAGEYNLKTQLATGNYSGSSKFFTLDPRILAMNKFLKDYNSPMASSAQAFITEADKYGLDWRLVASISGVESAFGNLIPSNSNNAWGWRGINKNARGWSMFTTWEAGIAEVTRGLAQGYGVTLSPFDIEPVYCPPCGQNPAHAWANGVTRFMNQLQYYTNNLESF